MKLSSTVLYYSIVMLSSTVNMHLSSEIQC